MRLVLQRSKFHDLLVEAIERGVAYGYRRAYKYEENPSEESVTETIGRAVIDEIFFSFEIKDGHQDEETP